MALVFPLARQAVTGVFSPTALPCVFQSPLAPVSDFQRGAHAYDAPLAQTRIGSCSSYPVSRSRVRFPSLCASGTHFHAVKLALGLVQSFAAQLLGQKIADTALVHLNRLSYSSSLDGSTTIEKALTYAQKSFASGANPDD